MTDNNQPLSFKKSVLSIVIISAVTGGLIACAKQQKLAQSFPTEVNQVRLENSIGSSDRQQAALIAPAESQEDEPVAPLPPPQQVDADLAIHNEAASASVSEQAARETTPEEADKHSAIDYQLLFALNSSEIDASYYSSLNDIAAVMKTADADPQMLWQVVGYTDPSGSAQYNMQLAEKRAQTVVEFLVDKGVAREKLAIVSLGESQLPEGVVDNHLQRRVEIHPFQAEIVALAEQLTPLKSVQQRVLTAQQQTPENRAEQKTAVQPISPGSLSETAKPLATAVEF